MSVKIEKSKVVKSGYYINGKGILLENLDFHKRTNIFSMSEIKAFENYLKAENDN